MAEFDLKQAVLDMKGFSVPQIQHTLGVSYSAARQCVDELLSEGLIRPVNKLRYAVRKRSPRVIPQPNLLENIYSEADRAHLVFMDAFIAAQFHNMTSAQCNELRNILRSAVPDGLPITAAVQKALDVKSYFSARGTNLLIRGVQFGREKLRCAYYVWGVGNRDALKKEIGAYKRSRPYPIGAVCKYLLYDLFVLDFPYSEALLPIGKQLTAMLVEKKVPRYDLSDLRRKLACGVGDFYHLVHTLDDLGVLRKYPAPHSSIAYKFSVEAKYFKYLLPDYLWPGKAGKTPKGEEND